MEISREILQINKKNHLFLIPMLYNSEILCNFAR